jgi:two-component system sensor histidine kinase CiaH
VFQSATFKLTTWYLAIIMAVSLLFSTVIYVIASHELVARLNYWNGEQVLSATDLAKLEVLQQRQIHQAEANLVAALLFANIGIWTAGGIVSFYLARKTLRPIEEAHEAQSRFTSDASHELRTPLASMKTEIEVTLRDPKADKQELRALLSSNLEEVDKLTKLSHTLLQLSRLDHGALPRETFFLDAVVASVLKRLDRQGRVTTEGQLTRGIIAHQTSTEELVTILFDNALKHSPPGSPITLRYIKKKSFGGFSITNAGKGISPVDLPHIFERFYRLDSSRTNSPAKGYGLGLSLAKRIVERNNGELSVASAPGHDTTFTVLLPLTSRRKTP